MRTDELDYELPESAIAQHPAEPRDSARLLVDRGPGLVPEHRVVADLADELEPGDVMVLNETKVIPARLQMHKPTGGAVEVLLLEPVGNGSWEALVRPSRRVPAGTRLSSPRDPSLVVEVGADMGEGRRAVTVEGAGDHLDGGLDRAGQVPLPPYITAPLADPARYQTVFAETPGSVAAPTAGLHLTTELLERCRSRGVEVVTVDLKVGLGTFRPITTEEVEDHPMHAERYSISPEVVETLGSKAGGGPGPRVVAVGTTALRALEAWSATGETEGSTELFVRPGFEFAVVDRLLTNFHVPRSSLLALVAAVVGDRWRDLYETALRADYRFLSFGDAMLISRQDAL